MLQEYVPHAREASYLLLAVAAILIIPTVINWRKDFVFRACWLAFTAGTIAVASAVLLMPYSGMSFAIFLVGLAAAIVAVTLLFIAYARPLSG